MGRALVLVYTAPHLLAPLHNTSRYLFSSLGNMATGHESEDAEPELGPTSSWEVKLTLRKGNSKQQSHPVWPTALAQRSAS